MTDSNQNLTEEQKRIQRLRAKTAARENQVGNRVGDKVTDPVILAELEKERELGRLRNFVDREEGTTPVSTQMTSQPEAYLATDTSTEEPSLTPPPKNLDDMGDDFKKAMETMAQSGDPSFENALNIVNRDFPNGISPEAQKYIPEEGLSKQQKQDRRRFINANKSCGDSPSSDNITVGKIIVPPNNCQDTTFDQMEADLNNFFDKITGPASAALNMPQEIKNVSSVMGRTMTKFTNKMTGSLNDKLEEVISGGFGKLSTKIFATVSKSFPYSKALAKVTKIQEGLFPSITSLTEAVYCVATKIIDSLPSIISDLVTAAVKNVTNAVPCAVQEIMGAINNKIVNMIDSVASPILGPISKVLDIVFNVKDFLLSSVDVMKSVASFAGCDSKKECPTSGKYVIGGGNKKGSSRSDTKSNFDKMFSGTALTQAATNLASDFEKEYGAWNIFGSPVAEASGIGPCYAGNPLVCGGPKVEIFGGGGFGAAGKVILGNIVDKVNLRDIYAGVQRTASIVGVEIEHPGSGYTDDPIITFDDECRQGSGAYGRAHVDQNPSSPTYGQLTSITMITTGDNYPADDEEVPLFIKEVIIENGGTGYNENDTLPDFDLDIRNGQVVGGVLTNWVTYDDLPELNINSETGYGAILKPIMSKTRPQGEIVKVIDCVS